MGTLSTEQTPVVILLVIVRQIPNEMFVTTGSPSDSPKSRVYEQQMSSSQFYELAQLSSDPNLLGNHLLNMAKSNESESNQS